MKKIWSIIGVVITLTLVSSVSYGQCRSFARNECRPDLEPFVHDGIFNATELSEGESAELYKTFYSNQEYRIAICGAATLPTIKFQIMDADRNVLFTNQDKNFARIWDFKLEASQQLIISIEVQTDDERLSDTFARGCIAVLIGFNAD
ncbi:MAG: hypothetical protein M0R02_09975 [Bacteroidales bacterium]|nr:hypothetical protein [Bacteroidales bacterium]NLK81025.1 hypothetical protein [Bacteroidales bacterium]